MAQIECTRCNGTGYASAARDSGMEDMPMMFRPIGVYPCSNCGGTGKLGLTEEDEEVLLRAVDEALNRNPELIARLTGDAK